MENVFKSTNYFISSPTADKFQKGKYHFVKQKILPLNQDNFLM